MKTLMIIAGAVVMIVTCSMSTVAVSDDITIEDIRKDNKKEHKEIIDLIKSYR